MDDPFTRVRKRIAELEARVRAAEVLARHARTDADAALKLRSDAVKSAEAWLRRYRR